MHCSTLLPAMASLGQTRKSSSVTNKYASVFSELSVKTPDSKQLLETLIFFDHRDTYYLNMSQIVRRDLVTKQ